MFGQLRLSRGNLAIHRFYADSGDAFVSAKVKMLCLVCVGSFVESLRITVWHTDKDDAYKSGRRDLRTTLCLDCLGVCCNDLGLASRGNAVSPQCRGDFSILLAAWLVSVNVLFGVASMAESVYLGLRTTLFCTWHGAETL